jgi:hypothetical protein
VWYMIFTRAQYNNNVVKGVYISLGGGLVNDYGCMPYFIQRPSSIRFIIVKYVYYYLVRVGGWGRHQAASVCQDLLRKGPFSYQSKMYWQFSDLALPYHLGHRTQKKRFSNLVGPYKTKFAQTRY